MNDPDLIIIGAGPAGMAAAVEASYRGAKVLLLEEQPAAGGQIYRNVSDNVTRSRYLGEEYFAGLGLVDALSESDVICEFGATVWRIEDGPRVVWSRDGVSRICSARHVLIAGGAQERPTPFPGWELTGVMSAGAAQILMKNAGLLPKDAILAGSGPLMYLIATQLIDAGAPPKAIVETQSMMNMLRSLRHLPRAMFAPHNLFKGLLLLRKIRKSGIVRFTGASSFRAGTKADGTIRFSFKVRDTAHQLDTSLVLAHQGVVPSTHMGRAAGVVHEWSAGQQTFEPIVDKWGRTNKSGIHIAGDGAGIGGAQAAVSSGRIAVWDILFQLGFVSIDQRNQSAAPDQAGLRRSLAIRPFLDAMYKPPDEILAPDGETVVCRCEELTASTIRKSIGEGASGPRQIKTSTRSGMGPCQGRLCDLPIQGILSSYGTARFSSQARTPIKPVKLGELADLAEHLEAESKPI